MIKLTLFNEADVIVNADLIESVERTPDTLITLTTGKKVMVKETVDDVITKVVSYRRLISRHHRLFGAKGSNSLRTEVKGFERWT
ncbi:MAG: flagellar FlbD family protein [Armatimonadota bacterium]|nr:flagellar FlbD family protein [bacterium]